MIFSAGYLVQNWLGLASLAILVLCVLASLSGLKRMFSVTSLRAKPAPMRESIYAKFHNASLALFSKSKRTHRRSPLSLTSSYVHLTRFIAREVLLGKSLSYAVRSLPQDLLKSSPYLFSVHKQLMSGASFEEALQIGANEVSGVLDKFYELIFTSSNTAAEELTKSLEMALRLAQFLQQHLSRERSRTIQMRMQFFLISCVVPVLFFANIFLFPEILWNAVNNFSSGTLLLFSLFLYLFGISLFRKMSLGSAELLALPKTKGARGSGRPAFFSSGLARKFFRNPLSQEIQNLIFLVVLELSLKTGKGARTALSSASRLASDSAYAHFAERILQMQARGVLLKESFLQLESELKSATDGAVARIVSSRVMETFFGIGSACHDLNLLTSFVSSAAEESKNTLKDLSEEVTGALTVQMLFPLCFCHLPAAFLMLLAPVLIVMAQAGF